MMLRADEARQIFEGLGLSYADIKEGDILALVICLNNHMRAAGKRADATPIMRNWSLLDSYNFEYDESGGVVKGFLRCKAHYFDDREAISFNEDGFIGFCGWADSKNEAPIIDAFIDWAIATANLTSRNEGEL